MMFLVMIMTKPIRKTPRLKEYDYSSSGVYFVTVCTKNRKPLLSKIVNVGAGVLDRPQVQLLPYGVVADKQIKQLNDFYSYLSVEKSVIMPNHIHMLISLSENGRSRTPAPTSTTSTIAQFISTFKRFCNKQYGSNIWQRSYYDHIVRGEQDYQDIWNYIDQNPDKWLEDELYSASEI